MPKRIFLFMRSGVRSRPQPRKANVFCTALFSATRPGDMNDWRNRSDFKPRDLLKVAAAILGLLFGCILLVWLLAKLAH